MFLTDPEELLPETPTVLADDTKQTEDDVKNSESETSSEDDVNVPLQLDHGIQESMLLPEEEIMNMVLRIAPGEGKRPLSLVYDDNAEELSFPRIYAGIKRQFKAGVKVSYTDIVKSEVRRYDRRACTPTKVLYAYKRLLVSRVADAITICLRKKKKSDGSCITAGQLRNSEFIASLLSHDDGFRMLKGIRSSPAYWEQQQKKLMAMLRQLGITTIFMTLSAAELRWPELLIQLHFFAHGVRLTEAEVVSLTWEQKVTLIRNDPVTCARHYDHRFRAFLNLLLKSSGGVFSPNTVTEWYARYEMQQRGSVHAHMMLWLCDAPVYDHEDSTSTISCTEFIDKFITCNRFTGNDELDNLVQYQLHRHARTCRRKTKTGSSCRFNFPIPPMASTVILEPLPSTTQAAILKTAQKNFDIIKHHLKCMGRQYKEDQPHSEFLAGLGLTQEFYLLAIRSSLKRTTVFLKRSTNAIFINAYNKKILKAWKANMDIQFVLDEYACARYVASYINKSNGGVSKLLRRANEDIKRGNHSLKDRLRMFGNIFNNFTEISAQEAAIGVLGIPLVNCSRGDIFINTSVPTERTFMLKSKAELEELPENSEDIAADSLINKYVRRPEELENISLADFASGYTYSKQKPKNRNFLKLIGGNGYLTKRGRPLIIRYRRFGKETDPANYFREQLMLFTSWRDEEKELLIANCEQKYDS
jgi:Helitron helicase-like domain at N-terminus